MTRKPYQGAYAERRSGLLWRGSARVLVGVCLAAGNGTATGDEAAQQTANLLEEITVTARQRTETVQDVPISISVITSADIEARGLGRVRDLVTSIPNVSFSDFGGVAATGNLVIRGISMEARNAGFESGVSVYVDSMYTGRPTTFNLDLVEIDRIEVLRGPQGTLFGKNTIAGALNITTIRPTDRLEAIFRGEVGNLDHRNISATVNLPMADRFAVRATAIRKKRDGTVLNLTTGDKYNDLDSYGGRVQALFEPSENLEILLSVDYTKDDNRPSFPEVLDGTDSGPFLANAPGRRTVRNDASPWEERRLWGMSLNLDWTLGNDGTVTSITGYREAVSNHFLDNDNTEFDLLIANFNRDEWHFTQELRYASPSSQFIDYVAGVYYLEQTAEQFNSGFFGVDLLSLFGLPDPVQLLTSAVGSVKTTSYAAFADVQFHITDALSIIIGARYTKERKQLAFEQPSEAPFILPEYPFITDRSFEGAFSPTAGLSYQVTDGLNTYAKVAKGFKSGGWNPDWLGQPDPPIFDPANDPNTFGFDSETALSYEAGMKWADSSNRTQVNVAAFYTDYKNLQVSQFLGILGGTVITNAAQATLKGFELDFRTRPTSALSLNGGLGNLSSRFDEYDNCAGFGVDCDGNRLPNAPKWTANLGAAYAVPVFGWGEVTMRGDYSYRGNVFATAANQDRLKAEGFGRVDLAVSLAPVDNRWEVTAWVNNVFDKDYANGMMDDVLVNDIFGVERTWITYGLPRTYGLRGRISF